MPRRGISSSRCDSDLCVKPSTPCALQPMAAVNQRPIVPLLTTTSIFKHAALMSTLTLDSRWVVQVFQLKRFRTVVIGPCTISHMGHGHSSVIHRRLETGKWGSVESHSNALSLVMISVQQGTLLIADRGANAVYGWTSTHYATCPSRWAANTALLLPSFVCASNLFTCRCLDHAHRAPDLE